MSEKITNAKLTSGSIFSLLTNMAFPMMIAIGGIIIFNLTDTYFVGQLGKYPLAALTFTFPVVIFFGSLALGIGTGTSAVVSRAIGEGNQQKVKRLTTDSLLLIFLISLVFVTIGMLTITPLFSAMGAQGTILNHVKDYMFIWYPGAIFVMIPMVGNNAIRATGDTKTPSIVMLIAAGVNLILDPILIFGWGPIPAMGIKGAAWATVIARAVTLVAAIFILAKRERMLTFIKPKINDIISSFRVILKIGIPTAVARILLPVGTGIITKLFAGHSIAAVAAYGICTRIEFFALAPVIALSSVMGPFVGQNAGANKHRRIQKGVSGSSRFVFLWGLGAWLFLSLTAPYLVGIFNDDPEIISVGVSYLQIASAALAFAGLLQNSGIVLNVLNRPVQSSLISLTQMFVLYVPMAYLLNQLMGLTGIFTANIIANTLAGMFAWWLLNRFLNKVESNSD